MAQEKQRKLFEVTVGGGYITWVSALDIEAATKWATERYGRFTKDIVVKGPLPEDYTALS